MPRCALRGPSPERITPFFIQVTSLLFPPAALLTPLMPLSHVQAGGMGYGMMDQGGYGRAAPSRGGYGGGGGMGGGYGGGGGGGMGGGYGDQQRYRPY